MKRGFVLLLAMTVFAAGKAHAATILFDNFDSENGGVGQLNYNAFANFTIITGTGTVDLIGFTGVGVPFHDLLPGNGLYVDLDGSTNDAGMMLADPLAVAAGDYVLSFDLAGSQRGDVNTVDVAVIGFFAPVMSSFVVASGDPFITRNIAFTSPGGIVSFVFQNSGGDSIGALLDNVRLESVPEPAMLLLLGLGALGFSVRYRHSRFAKH